MLGITRSNANQQGESKMQSHLQPLVWYMYQDYSKGTDRNLSAILLIPFISQGGLRMREHRDSVLLRQERQDRRNCARRVQLAIQTERIQLLRTARSVQECTLRLTLEPTQRDISLDSITRGEQKCELVPEIEQLANYQLFQILRCSLAGCSESLRCPNHVRFLGGIQSEHACPSRLPAHSHVSLKMKAPIDKRVKDSQLYLELFDDGSGKAVIGRKTLEQLSKHKERTASDRR